MKAATATAADLPHSKAIAEPGRASYWREVGRRLLRDRVAMVCLSVLALMALAMIFAPLLSPYDPLQGSMVRRLKPVGTPGHWLGTDELGRDMFARLIFGGRLSWFVGITPVAVAFVIGSGLGITAGFFGGWVNMMIMRTTDVFYAFPSVLLAVAISGALGPGIDNAIIAMTMVFIPMMIRVSESVTASTRPASP
jgi:peptide/nickel transport system permease protein